jgi:branched-chain amino acid transport system ATP-binding protein
MTPRRFPMLVAEGLTAAYRRDAPVVRDVSVEVAEHEVVCILGSNGAGKTTLLRAISGLVPHVEGAIRFLGEDVNGVPPHELVARGLVHMPSGREIAPSVSVRDTLLVGAHAFRRDRARVRRMLADVLERFPVLAERAGRPAGSLSGGERQVLLLGRALMGRPRLLMLDEASAGLAPRLARELFGLVRSLWEDGVTVLMVEKAARAALAVSHRAYVMELGRVVAAGPAKVISRDERLEIAYLGRGAASRGE